MTDVADHLAALERDGFCILRGLLPLDLVDAWRAAFAPRLAETMRGPTNRGPARWYVDLPFAPPFADPRFLEHPALVALVEATLGEDALLLQLGADTPAIGSEPQGVHSDVADLFPGSPVVAPTFVLTVNAPLVDVHPANGPFAVARGTHRLSADEARRRVADGEAPLEPLLLRRGDVLVRDPRTLHRGTACLTAEPRPVLITAFQRPWLRHGTARIALDAAVEAGLSPRLRRWLRLHTEAALERV